MVPMTASPDQQSGEVPTAPRSNRAFRLALVLLIGLFIVVLLQRQRLRAHYWAWKIAQSESLEERGRYLNALMSVGEPGIGAMGRLAADPDPDLRMLAVMAYRSLPRPAMIGGLRPMMADADVDVRESAALGLAFDGHDAATATLKESVLHPDAHVASAAAAALARVTDPSAAGVLTDALMSHPSPLVRAQAAESIGAWLIARTPSDEPGFQFADAACLRALFGAHSDQGRFDGMLSLEREIQAASVFAASRGMVTAAAAAPGSRTVAQVALAQLAHLCDAHESAAHDDGTLDEHVRLCVETLQRKRAEANRLDRFAETGDTRSTDTSD